MAEADGKGLLMLTHKDSKKMRLCVSYFVSVFMFLVRATMITRYHKYARVGVKLP